MCSNWNRVYIVRSNFPQFFKIHEGLGYETKCLDGFINMWILHGLIMNWEPKEVQKIRFTYWEILNDFHKMLQISEDSRW